MIDNNPNHKKRNALLDELDIPTECGPIYIETEVEGERQKQPYHITQPFSPFKGTQRSVDKSRIIQFLTNHPKGVPCARICKALFPASGDRQISEREYTNTDYRFVRRFLDRSEYARVERSDGQIFALPETSAFHLTQESKIPTDYRAGYAKDRAEAFIGRISDLNSPDNCRYLTRQFLTYLDSINDTRLMLQEEQNKHMKITMPYHTRFNNEQRKKEQWARYNTAWEKAEKYEKGVLITLTTDPKRYDSLSDMVDGLMNGWQDLLETLNQRYSDRAPASRLDFIRALEFGGSEESTHVGLPHLHCVVFGVPYVEHAWLKSYWSAKHAEIVHIHSMNKRGSESWIMQSGAHKGKSAAGYLGKYLSESFESITKNTKSLRRELESWEHSPPAVWKNAQLWKLALYWATGRQFWSCSHDLKGESCPDRLEDVDGLGETKLDRLRDHGIHTLSDVRLAEVDDLSAVDGISQSFAERLKELVGSPSRMDVFSFEFVGAASYQEMPADWSASANHIGIATG